jgi:cation diffusion facilitator family transporter
MTPRRRARRRSDHAFAANWLAIRLSLLFGVFMLAGKVVAYVMTGSAAILSDAAESIIHVVAVGFAAFSLWLSSRPADHRFPYGYERVAFFSAGFEGAMIILAALTIIFAAVQKWITGLELERLGTGTLLVGAAALVNAALGVYLVRTGRRNNSLILEANGKHVLTDSWTSAGVIVGLLLVMATGWVVLDPLVAIAVAANILWSGGRLVSRSVGGLMDYVEPGVRAAVDQKLDALAREEGVDYHRLRVRHTGQRLIVDVHLLLPFDMPLGEAHRAATRIEKRLDELTDGAIEVVTHLEALEDHGDVHRRAHEPDA